MKKKLGIIFILIGIIPLIIIPIIGDGIIFEVYKFITSVLFQVICVVIGSIMIDK